MSQKKRKKRHSQPVMDAKRQATQARLADERDRARKRMDPTARTLLFGNLIFLAICQILYSQGMISDFFSGMATLLGIVLLILALYFQFGRKRKDGGSGWPK